VKHVILPASPKPETHNADMNEWGYSFKLGAAPRCFHEDAEDVHHWRRTRNLINKSAKHT